MALSVRENAALSSLPRFAQTAWSAGGPRSRRSQRERDALQIRTPSLETGVEALSGGNQQKVVLARALLTEPQLVLADEPTQGVDAGARIEIYRILREIAESGVPVLIVSSDGLELEGLCDRVIVFSRGRVAGELRGAEVTEEQIARTMLTATTHRAARRRAPAAPGSARRERVRRFLGGDYLPSVVLALVIVPLGPTPTARTRASSRPSTSPRC